MSSRHNILALLAILLTCVSCAAPKVAQDYQRDSVVLIVRDSVTLRDTVVLVQVPEGSDRAVLTDTDTSRLSTSVAESEAYVKDGRLHHTLRNKEALLPVTITIPEKARSELRSQSMVDRQYIEVEKELSRWQRFIMSLGYVALGAVLLWLVSKIRRIIV